MLKFPRNKSFQKGQLTIEAIIAIFVLTTAVLLFVGLLSRSMGFNGIISDQYTAVYLANEGIEIVKNIVDGNYMKKIAWNLGGFEHPGDYELSYNSTTLQGNQDRFLYAERNTGLLSYKFDGTPTKYKRLIHIQPVGRNEIAVISIVTWESHGVPFEIKLEDHFYDWR